MGQIKCPICGNLQTKELFKTKKRYQVVNYNFILRKCLKCGIVFTCPILSWEKIKKIYPKTYSWKKDYRAETKLTKLLRMAESWYVSHLLKYETKRLLKFVGRKGKILDIGCGAGSRLESFKEAGFKQFYGIEPSPEALYAQKNKKLPVEQKPLDKFNCPNNSFDIVTLFHVFEHLNDPLGCLKNIKKILKPGGYLVIQVPNLNSFQAKLFKGRWFGLDIPLHYFHYTPETISSLLLKNGYQIRSIDYKTNFLHPVYWVLSSFISLDPQSMWQEERKGRRTFLCRLLWIILTLFSIVIVMAENLFNQGGNITIYAANKK